MTSKKYFSSNRFEDVKDLYEWKHIPNFPKYVINEFGDVYNHMSGQCVNTYSIKRASKIVAIDHNGKKSWMAPRKIVRELFGIGYIRQREMQDQKNAIFHLAQDIQKSV